jgi:phosphoenolpyruvate carboxylase
MKFDAPRRPVDEAKWGFTTIEQTLWYSIPQFLREFDEVVFEHTGQHLPLTHAPIRFASWMGGDRDGNPNVTHKVTQEVLFYHVGRRPTCIGVILINYAPNYRWRIAARFTRHRW